MYGSFSVFPHLFCWAKKPPGCQSQELNPGPPDWHAGTQLSYTSSYHWATPHPKSSILLPWVEHQDVGCNGCDVKANIDAQFWFVIQLHRQGRANKGHKRLFSAIFHASCKIFKSSSKIRKRGIVEGEYWMYKKWCIERRIMRGPIFFMFLKPDNMFLLLKWEISFIFKKSKYILFIPVLQTCTLFSLTTCTKYKYLNIHKYNVT